MSDDYLKEDQTNFIASNKQIRPVPSQPLYEAEVMELEAKLACYCGVKHAIACSSASDALLMALLSYGVGPGDAILTTPFNDTLTVSVIRRLGATPVFVDIDQSTFNLDPEQLETAIGALLEGDASIYPLPGKGISADLKPRGIVSPDLFGLPADYDAINAIAGKYKLFVIEDASLAFGGQYKGRCAGSLGDISFTSFAEDAPLTSEGSGGMCLTDNDHLAERMLSLRTQGAQAGDQNGNQVIRVMDTLKAVAVLAKFEILAEEIRLRQEAAQCYTKFMDENPLLITPYVPEEVLPTWGRYCMLTESNEDRAVMLKKLQDAGIPAEICYTSPLYLLEEFFDLQYREGDFPVSEDYAMRMFSVPMHPYLTMKNQEEVADLLNDWQ